MAKPLGDHLQNVIAHAVAADIVDALKAVEIEDEERVAAIAAGIARGHGGLERLQQRAPIGELRQRILHGELAHLAQFAGKLGGAELVQAMLS